MDRIVHSALVLEFNFQIMLTKNVQKVTTDEREAAGQEKQEATKLLSDHENLKREVEETKTDLSNVKKV
jgi:hypothetical protein